MPVFKLSYWGCFKLHEEVKTKNHHLSSNLRLIPFTVGDKSDFTQRRYLKMLNVNGEQLVSYKVSWVKPGTDNSQAIMISNIGECFRDRSLEQSRLYVTLESGWFEKGKKSSEKNVEVLMSIVDDNDETLSNSIVEGPNKNTFYRSSVRRHCNTPKWYEMMTVSVSDETFDKCFIKFECSHITSSELTHKSSLKWVTYIPLQAPQGNVTPDGRYHLRLLPNNSYVSKHLWESDVLIKPEMLQSSKNVQQLVISTRLDSDTLTDTPAIHKIKAWKCNSRDLEKVLHQLNKADFRKCMRHCKEIFTSILEIIDSCADGVIIELAMKVLFSFGQFWKTSDELKNHLLDVLGSAKFISGILKFVSWIRIIFKDHKTALFRQTIKSFSFLITIMSKSFVSIKQTEVMTRVETERYKVILVNLIMDICHIDAKNNLILSSQIIKVFPESLSVLYSDGIISINEFSFHMVSMLKAPLLMSLKENQSTRSSFIEYLKFVVDSDLMRSKDLKVKYFLDLAKSFHLVDSYPPLDTLAIADILVLFCEGYNTTLTQQPEFFLKVVTLLEPFLLTVRDNVRDLNSLEAMLTFLSLLSTYFSVIELSPRSLENNVHLKFIETVKVTRKAVKAMKSSVKRRDVPPEMKQIMQTALCKRISLILKVTKFSNVMDDKMLLNDVTYIGANVLEETLDRLDMTNAPYHMIYNRIREPHSGLFECVFRNALYLCRQELFDKELMGSLGKVLISESVDLNNLFVFVDVFLSKFPDRLDEILTSIHENRASLKAHRGLLIETEFESDSTILVQNLVELLKCCDMQSVQMPGTKALEIKTVLDLVDLFKFYSKHQCWVPFLEVVNEYKSLLIDNDAFVEAAELTVHCCNIVQSKIIPDKENELFTAVTYYTEAGLWSKALEVLTILQAVYIKQKTKESFARLSEISSKCAALYANLAEKPHIPFHYFLVGLYGRELSSSFQNKLFIFRGNPLENIAEFCKRLSPLFPGYEQINSAKIPRSDEVMKYSRAYQVIKVDPVTNKNHQYIEEASMKFKKFSYEFCFVKDKNEKNDLLRMSYQRFSFSIESFLPSYIPFCEISGSKCVNISPLEMALEQIQKKSTELSSEAKKFGSGEGNIKQFQMLLNGTIDAAVNGGTEKLVKTFLSDQFAEQNPGLINKCGSLKRKIDEQKVIIEECLTVHDEVCPAELRMLHEKMVHQHSNKDFNEGEFMRQMSGEPVPATLDLPQNHRSALLEEITRRSSKLKKSVKVSKRVTSSFFDLSLSTARPQDPAEEVETIKQSEGELINPAEFEATYANLCNGLNHDFNLHNLPRYSTGRRGTMCKPAMPDGTPAQPLLQVDTKSAVFNNYSSRKELKESHESLDVSPDLPVKRKTLSESMLLDLESQSEKESEDREKILTPE